MLYLQIKRKSNGHYKKVELEMTRGAPTSPATRAAAGQMGVLHK